MIWLWNKWLSSTVVCMAHGCYIVSEVWYMNLRFMDPCTRVISLWWHEGGGWRDAGKNKRFSARSITKHFAQKKVFTHVWRKHSRDKKDFFQFWGVYEASFKKKALMNKLPGEDEGTRNTLTSTLLLLSKMSQTSRADWFYISQACPK